MSAPPSYDHAVEGKGAAAASTAAQQPDMAELERKLSQEDEYRDLPKGWVR